jgi:hypothetical protein
LLFPQSVLKAQKRMDEQQAEAWMSSPLVFSHDELVANHPYERPHLVGGQKFHGGFVSEGAYVPPRTLNRIPAVSSWSQSVEARGWPLIDCAGTQRSEDLYPNLPQQRLSLESGLRQAFWDELTVIAVNEGRGEAMCYIKPIDLQALIEEDISTTATGHLWKGLFWAHGVDEAGDRAAPDIGGHKHMWLAARDLLMGRQAYPPPAVPPQHSRPKNGGREAPSLPPEVEKMFEACMAVLHVECRAYPHFDLCLALCRDPSLFERPAGDVDLAADIIARIRADEASHVGYLRCFVSELRSFTFRCVDGVRRKGFEILDPIWQRQVEWPDAGAKAARRAGTRNIVAAEAAEKLSAAECARLLDRFDALAYQ